MAYKAKDNPFFVACIKALIPTSKDLDVLDSCISTWLIGFWIELLTKLRLQEIQSIWRLYFSN